MERVVIETGTRDDATAIAASLPGNPKVGAGHGYSVIRMQLPSAREAKAQILPLVEDCVQRGGLKWARVRIGDVNHHFRG